MNEVALPVNTFSEFLLLFLILSALALSQLIMAFFSLKKRRILLESVNKELPEVIKIPLILRLKTRPTHFLHLFLLVLLVVAMFRFWEQGFSSFQYDNEKIGLKYHNRLKPVILNWADISCVELGKKHNNSKTAIVIQSIDGKVYKSNSVNSKSKASEFEEAYLKLKDIYENRTITYRN